MTSWFASCSRYGVASTYYGISLNITGFGLDIYLTHFIYAIIELPAKFIIYFSLKKFGRRVNQVGTQVLTGVCIIITIITPKGDKLMLMLLWHLNYL